MSRLPVPGSDMNVWGEILNDFLKVAHNTDGSLRGSVLAAAGAVTSVNGVSPINGALSLDIGSAQNAVQLAGDLGGTSANPMVTHTHLATALPINQGGTGATTQTFVDLTTNQTIAGAKVFGSGSLLDAGSQVFNVKAYGALGNGSNDDANAIQAAVSAASIAGGIVYFPSGTYSVGTPIIVTGSGVTLQGANRFGSVLKMRPSFGARDASRGIFEFGIGPNTPAAYLGCAIYDLGFDNVAVADQADGINYKNMPNAIYQDNVPMVNFDAQRLYFNLGVNGQGVLFEKLGFLSTGTYSKGLNFRDIYCINGAGTVSCYNRGNAAGALMSDITVENIVNICNVTGLNDDRICISGDNGAESASPSVETRDVAIHNTFVTVTDSAGGTINGVKLDCGDGGFIHDVEITNVFYTSQPTIASNNPVLCELGPSASGTMQNISVDGIHAINSNALILRFWRNNTAGHVVPYMMVRNVHMTNCQDSRVLELNVANSPFGDEYMTIEDCVLHASSPSSTPGPVGLLLNVGSNIQGVSGQTMIRNVTVRGSCLTGITNNLNENLQTIGSAWTNIIIEDCELSSPMGLGGEALNMINSYRVKGTRGVNPVNGVVSGVSGDHTAALDEITVASGANWTWTLPAPTPQGTATLVNAGTGDLGVTALSGNLYSLVGGSGNQTVSAGVSVSYVSDGSNWYATSESAAIAASNPVGTVFSSSGTHTAANGETTVAHGAGLWTWTLPSPVTHGYTALINSTSGTVTAHTPTGTLYATSGTTGNQQIGASVTTSYVSDGTNWYQATQSSPSTILVPTLVKTAAYAALPGDFIPVDVSSGNVTITLPAAPIDKSRIGVKLITLGSGTNQVSVVTSGSDVLNQVGGSTTLSLTTLNQAVTLQYAASTSVWYVVDGLNLSSLDARYIQGSTVTGKGDVLVGTAPGTVTRLGVGRDGQVLTANAAQSSGLQWTTPAGALIVNALDNGLVGDGTTNDQPALQALVNSLGGSYVSDRKPRIIFCPAATYALQNNGTVWKSGVSLVGAGPGVTRFTLSNPVNTTNPTPLASYTATFNGASTSSPLTDCSFANFEVDGSGVSLAAYNTGAKALVLQYMVRARFYNLYIHDCGATGLGCDFLQDSIIDGVLAISNGRLNNGSQPGGAGIGVGIGGWGSVERTTIVNCTTRGNGTHGIFVELQNNTYTPPCGIRIIGCHSEANKHGISDWGADGLVVSNCTIVGNSADGFNVSGAGVASIAGRGGMVTGCTIANNSLDGILIGDTPGKYVIRDNRISGNSQHGIHLSNTIQGTGFANTEQVIDGNDIYLNANCGIRIDNVFTDGFIINNRIRNNGTATSSTTDLRAGISFNQAANTPMVQNNRSWDNQGTKTQTYGIYATATGSLGTPVMQNNNFNGNLSGAWSTSSTVSGGNLVLNLGFGAGVTSSAQTSVVDGAELVNGSLRYSGATRSFTGTALAPSSSANTFGTAQTCSPDAGQQGFVIFSMIRAVFSGTFSSETATVNVTATFSDNSTASATMTAAGASTQVLASGGLLSLAKDGLYVKSVQFQLESTIANSLVSATPSLVAAQC